MARPTPVIKCLVKRICSSILTILACFSSTTIAQVQLEYGYVLAPSIEQKVCVGLIKGIVEDHGWEYSDSLGHYQSDKGMLILNEKENLACLKELKRKQIEKLFGTPSEINEALNRYEYNLTAPCGKHCKSINFVFSDSQTVTAVNFVMGDTFH